MKILVHDIYEFYAKNVSFHEKHKDHKVYSNLREVLLEIWTGEVTSLILPEKGTPGYNFEEFIDNIIMMTVSNNCT